MCVCAFNYDTFLFFLFEKGGISFIIKNFKSKFKILKLLHTYIDSYKQKERAKEIYIYI